MSSSNFVSIAKVADVPAGEKKLVEHDGVAILLCNSNDKVFAVENLCSHADEALDCGRMKRGWIACPAHGARFDLETGEPMNPPATQPIRTFEVRIENDEILVAI